MAYLHPGVYVEEIPSGSKPIEGVGTSIAAFVGGHGRGPKGTAELVHSWDDYEKLYGPVVSSDDAMGMAVSAFYQNGGKDAYICRLVKGSPTRASLLLAGSGTKVTDGLKATALDEGASGNSIQVSVVQTANKTFTLKVGPEEYTGVDMDSASAKYVVKVVNARSRLVSLEMVGTGKEQPDALAATPLAGGASSALTKDEYKSFFSSVLRKVRDVSILVLPGQSWPANGSGNACISEAIAHCEATRSRMVIIDPAAGTELDTGAKVETMTLPSSTYSVLYYPSVSVANPLYDAEKAPAESKTVQVGASALAAGMWSKIDGKRGVWKAPAGMETGLLGVAGLEYHIEDGEQDQLNPMGVNCLRKMPGAGPVIWGSRTLATKADPEWRYVPVRRTAIMIEQSIYNGIQWAVFEPNKHTLWSALRANIGGFMNGLFRAGAFQGEKASDAYFVRCGLGDTMTQTDIDAGQVIVVVGFAALKPAEFVIVRIQQKVNQQ